HYASFDPRDEDLRAAVAALLCLGGEAQRAVNFLKLIQDDRASERHESFARDYGDARWLLVACAWRGGITPPAKPERTDAGRLDHAEARAVLRLKLLTEKSDRDPRQLYDAASATIDLLQTPRSPGARAILLTALAATGYSSLD